MSTTEYLLVALVIVIPAIIAIMVTLWTLEQALKRNRKYRNQSAGARKESGGSVSGDASSS